VKRVGFKPWRKRVTNEQSGESEKEELMGEEISESVHVFKQNSTGQCSLAVC